MKNAKKTEIVVTVGAALAAVVLLAVGVFAQSAGFRWFGPLSRVLTPNGDGRNDAAFFCFDDPADSDASGRVYSLLGAEVATLGPRQQVVGGVPGCAAGALPGSAQYLTWDGRSNGSVVGSGVYIYRVSAEQKVYTGTLIVVR
ncbi:MAG: hypothetical protein HY079_12025 [Elusimicrobia bacterium]|nr:hypothetical protein [Elusimicrobiota bacterium]